MALAMIEELRRLVIIGMSVCIFGAWIAILCAI